MGTKQDKAAQPAEAVEIDWNDPIPEDNNEFVILPDGTTAIFEIKKLEKDRSQQGNPMAKLELIAEADDGRRAYIHDQVTLCAKALFRVRQFGVSIGDLEPDKPGNIDWDNAVGKTGCIVVTVEKFTGRDGQERTSNKVKAWLPPKTNSEPAKTETEEGPAFG